MKKIISALILSLLLCSCVTRQACERLFANAWLESRDGGIGAGADINTTASTNRLTLIRDTTIYVKIPGDTSGASVLLNDVVRLNATLASDQSTEVSRLKTQLGISSIWLADGRLHHRLEQKDTAVVTTLKGALKTSNTHDKKEQTIIPARYINHLTGWQWTQVYLGRAFLGILILLALWKVLSL